MPVSVRLEPLLDRELTLTAKRMGVSKSQFIISALEKVLGRKDPYELLLKINAQTESKEVLTPALNDDPFKGDLSNKDERRAFIAQKLRSKHGFDAG